VANVLVGPDFVAVGLHRAADWERLLRPVLDVVTDEFADPDAPPDTSGRRVMGGPAGAGVVGAGPPSGAPTAARTGADPGAAGDRRPSRLEQAWHDLGTLRPGAGADDLARVREASAGDDPARRQVAANLLGEADPGTAATDWARLVVDPVRSVRRAAVDAVVDAGRPELRGLLETALADADAWVRWKALRGLAELGPGPSRAQVAALADDPDFRVRLEVAAALRRD
jgi:HEAT repeat protein